MAITDPNSQQFTPYLICDPVADGGSPDNIGQLTQVTIGGVTLSVSAAFEIQSTTGGFLLPRMDTDGRDDLISVPGMMVYNTDTDTLDVELSAGIWTSFSSGSAGLGTVTSVANAVSGVGLSITGTNPIVSAGTWTFTLGSELQALSALSSTGLLARTAANTYAERTITGTTSRISLTNGNGVAGNPTIDIDAGYVGQSSITTVGTLTALTVSGTANFNLDVNFAAGSHITTGGDFVAPYGNFFAIANSTGVFSTLEANNSNASQYIYNLPTITGNDDLLTATSTETLTNKTWHGVVITGTYGGTGVNNGASTITLGGSLTTSGAYASTFTMTNTTNVTFPTSGTLATTAGVINTITGTALQIDVTAGVNPVISIDSGYVGQTSITTLGTIGTGTWAGTNVALNHGGTNAALSASNGGIIYSTASAMAVLSGTATANQLLLSGSSTTPAWSTSTYPATNAVNTLLYASSANVMAALATANSSVLVTSAGGVPSLSTALPSGITLAGDATTALQPVTYQQLQAVSNGLYFKQAVNVATTGSNLVGTYLNGSSGVGATFTYTATGVDTIDGVDLTLGMRVLLKDQTSGFQNGIYSVTTAGAGGIAGILTRTTDYNLPAQILPGDVVSVISGTANATTAWLQTATITTIGTDALVFSQYDTIVAGTGLTKSASTISLTSPVTLTLGGTNASLTASNGGIIYSTASAMAVLSGTATGGQLLLSGSSTTPAWSTSTYPSTNAANTLLYASSASTMAALATGNNGVLITSGAGAPSISSTLPSAVQGNITTVGTIGTGTWQGAIITGTYGGTGVNNGANTLTVTANSTINQNVSTAGSPAFVAITTDSISSKTAATSLDITSNANTVITNAASGYTLIQTTGGGSGVLLCDTIEPHLSHELLLEGRLQITSGYGITTETTAGHTYTLGGWSTGASAEEVFATITCGSPPTAAFAGTANFTLTWDKGVIGGITPAAGTFTDLTANTSLTVGSTTYPTTVSASNLLYSNGANTVAGLATANSSVLTTNGSGVPSWTANVAGVVSALQCMGLMFSYLTNGATLTQGASGTYASNYRGFSFAASGNNYAGFRIMLPSNWDGSTLNYRIAWQSGTTTGNVVWNVQCIARANGDQWDQAFGTAISITSTVSGSANYTVLTAKSSAMTAADETSGPCELEVRINRNGGSGSDTMAGTAIMTSFMLYYGVTGSAQT